VPANSARQCSWACICIVLHVSFVFMRQVLQATTGQVFPQNSKTATPTLPLHLACLHWHTLRYWCSFTFCASDSACFCSSGRAPVTKSAGTVFCSAHQTCAVFAALGEYQQCWCCFAVCTSDLRCVCSSGGGEAWAEGCADAGAEPWRSLLSGVHSGAAARQAPHDRQS